MLEKRPCLSVLLEITRNKIYNVQNYFMITIYIYIEGYTVYTGVP